MDDDKSMSFGRFDRLHGERKPVNRSPISFTSVSEDFLFRGLNYSIQIQHPNTNNVQSFQLHVITTSTYLSRCRIIDLFFPGTHVDEVAFSKESESHEMIFFFGEHS